MGTTRRKTSPNLLRNKRNRKTKLGQKLLEYRKKHQLSAENMANRLEISASFYLYVERGVRGIGYRTACNIAAILKVTADTVKKWHTETGSPNVR